MLSEVITRLGLVLIVGGLCSGQLLAVASKPKAAKSHKTSSALDLGDRAPALTVSRWVKGAPVKGFKKGEVYVVEFWATWCGPCKLAIPHLTELTKRFEGRATFIGVDIFEKGAPAAVDKKVDTFVENMGARMDYHVGQDRRDGSMAKAWMKAAGQEGIPTAFIVDKVGRIAWIGFPDSLEEPLKEILAGTYDAKIERASLKASAAASEAKMAAWSAEREAADKVLQGVRPDVEKAMEAKDWNRALGLVEQAESQHPDLPTLQKLFHLSGLRVRVLANTDPAKAEAMLEASLTPPTLPNYRVAIYFLMTQLLNSDPHWCQLGLNYIAKACAMDEKFAKEISPAKFGFLLRTDEAKAKALFEAEKRQFDNNGILEMVDHLLTQERVSTSWLEAAVSVLEPLKKDPQHGHTLAKAYFRLGRAKEALPLQAQFLAYLKGEEADQDTLREFEAELKSYQAAAQ